MHFPSICKEVADCAFPKKCSSVNCIYIIVENNNIIQVAKAVQSARTSVYHIHANIAHEKLRDLLKSGQCRDNGEVIAYFDHIRVLTATIGSSLKIKVSQRGLYGIVLEILFL